MFTKEQPPRFAVLNSISNAPNYGDERNWVAAQVGGGEDWGDDVDVKPGDVVTVRFYYENSAQDVLSTPRHPGFRGLVFESAIRLDRLIR